MIKKIKEEREKDRYRRRDDGDYSNHNLNNHKDTLLDKKREKNIDWNKRKEEKDRYRRRGDGDYSDLNLETYKDT